MEILIANTASWWYPSQTSSVQYIWRLEHTMSTIWSVHFQLLLQLSCAFVCCTLCVTDVFVCIGVNSRSLWLWDKFLGGIQVCDWSFVLWCFHLSWVAVISMYNHDENPNLLNVMILHSYIHIWLVLMCRVLDPEDIWGEDSAEILRQDPENLKVGCCTNAVYKDIGSWEMHRVSVAETRVSRWVSGV